MIKLISIIDKCGDFLYERKPVELMRDVVGISQRKFQRQEIKRLTKREQTNEKN